MSLKLHNTLTGKTEDFKPIKAGLVSMYNCGPTVYNYAHIGNLRAYIFTDLLRRALEYLGFEVNQMMNITDVGQLTSDADSGEDKMTKALLRESKPLTLEAMQELGEFYTQAFFADLKKLNIKTPTIVEKASDHIDDDINFIRQLEVNGFTYKISDGIYFDIGKLPQYGRLGGLNQKNTEARIIPNPEKHDQRDFTLWKFNDKLGWESPWGKGFPGWHIECSAMSKKYLGVPFDIHTGGVDHIPVHHNNEIAQGEAADGQIPAKFWLHNEHLTMAGGKMAKSAGNFQTLESLKKAGFPPLAYRYWLLGASYRTQMNYSEMGILGAKNAYFKLKSDFLALGENTGKIAEKYQKSFTESVANDLNTPESLALVWKLLADPKISPADKRATLIDFDRVLGLGLAQLKSEPVPEPILKLLQERENARKNQEWKLADDLREQIKATGFEIEDTETGPRANKII